MISFFSRFARLQLEFESCTHKEAHREQLQKLGVKSLSLFGSVARDEADADSDVDLLVEFDRQGGFFSTSAI